MKEPVLKFRPSNADRAMSCPASLHPEEGEPLVSYAPSGGVASIGSAAHDILNRIVMQKAYNLEEISAKWGVKTTDLEYLKYTAYAFFELLENDFDVEAWFSETEIEVDTPFTLKGKPDLIGVTKDGKTLIVADYKTGRASASHINQIKAYAHLALSQMPDTIETIIGLILWARDLEIQKWSWTREDLRKWAENVINRVYNWDGIHYTVGEHCIYCQRHVSCEARAREMKRAHELMLLPETSILSPKDFSAAWQASIMIPKKIEDWRNRMKERIQATGAIDMGDRKVLDVIERNTKPEIKTVETAKILQDNWSFTDKDIMECSEMSKKSIQDKAAADAGRGQKGKVRKEIIEDLEEQGAIVPKKTLVLKVMDNPKGIEEGGV